MKTTFKVLAIALISSSLFSCEKPVEIAPEQIQFDNVHIETADLNTPSPNTQETKTTLPQLK